MPRIRSIKPDYWTDDKIVQVSIPARLLFIGMWNFADDAGNLEFSTGQLKMRILPADPVDISPLVDELLGVGVLHEYSVNGRKYLHIQNFTKHQVINKPSKTRLPAPDTTVALPFGSGSGSGSGMEKEKEKRLCSVPTRKLRARARGEGVMAPSPRPEEVVSPEEQEPSSREEVLAILQSALSKIAPPAAESPPVLPVPGPESSTKTEVDELGEAIRRRQQEIKLLSDDEKFL